MPFGTHLPNLIERRTGGGDARIDEVAIFDYILSLETFQLHCGNSTEYA